MMPPVHDQPNIFETLSISELGDPTLAGPPAHVIQFHAWGFLAEILLAVSTAAVWGILALRAIALG